MIDEIGGGGAGVGMPIEFVGMEIFAQEAMMKSMTKDQKAWARSTPRWIYFDYAVAVSTGVAGSIGLLLRQDWTVALFAICLVAVLVQMGYTMVVAGGYRVMGPSGAVMPSVVIVLAAALLGFSWFASSQNWSAEVGPAIGPGAHSSDMRGLAFLGKDEPSIRKATVAEQGRCT